MYLLRKKNNSYFVRMIKYSFPPNDLSPTNYATENA